jgi:hypothetical protein
MGAALAACIDGQVLWASEGRSEATRIRAEEAGVLDRGGLESLLAIADVVISVCPPGAAVDVANQVVELGFDGVYVDANAVSPATTRQMAPLFSRFVDGGIIGPPPKSAQTTPSGDPARTGEESTRTRFYLAGPEAAAVGALFSGSSVEARVVGPEPGRASALKMAYAAWTKGSTALLLSVAAVAAAEAVTVELAHEWELSLPGLGARLERISSTIGTKAWRFVGEMEEIAGTYGDAGLPTGFHLASAELYARLAELKDDPNGRHIDEIVGILLDWMGSGGDD